MSCESATARDKSDHSSLFLSACSTHRRDDAGRSPRRIVRRKAKCTDFTGGYRNDTRGRTFTFCAKNDGGGMEGLMAFLSACSTHRRDDAARSPRQIVRRKPKCRFHRRISHDTRGRTAAFCAKNDVGGMEGLIGFLGSVGGALRMNAGAYSTQIGSYVRGVKLYPFRKVSG